MLITESNIHTALMILEGSDLLAVDTETSGLDVANSVDYLMGISFSNGDFDCYFPFRHKFDNLPRRFLDPLVSILRQKDLIWHHRKFDMHSLSTIEIDPLKFEGIQYDTMLLSHLWNEEQYSHELDFLGKKWLGYGKIGADDIKTLRESIGQENIPAKVMAPYASQDGHVTYEFFHFIWPKIEEQELDKVYLNTEMPFTRLLYKMEQKGVGVNREFTETKARIGRGRMGSIYRELGFNPSSPIDLGRVLLNELQLPVFAHTSSCEDCKRRQPLSNHKGKPSFNKKAMIEYDEILQASDNKTAQLISEYRGWQKATTSLYEPLLERVGPDGRIRTNFKQHGTVTGRLSAEHPNLQQVPRSSSYKWNGNAKSAFTSGREGYTLIGWDYSQLELRLAAAYGNETTLLREFTKPDADPFDVLAKSMNLPRHDTKTFHYATQYGAGLAKIALQLGRPITEVEEIYRSYKASLPGIMAISSRIARSVEIRKFVKYWDGRRRHFRNRRDSYKAWNSVCQGGAAQLVKQAMLRCEEFENEECQMVLQVHDEITFIIKTDRIEHYRPMIEHAMTDWPDFGVTLAVEGKEWK